MSHHFLIFFLLGFNEKLLMDLLILAEHVIVHGEAFSEDLSLTVFDHRDRLRWVFLLVPVLKVLEP